VCLTIIYRGILARFLLSFSTSSHHRAASQLSSSIKDHVENREALSSLTLRQCFYAVSPGAAWWREWHLSFRAKYMAAMVVSQLLGQVIIVPQAGDSATEASLLSRPSFDGFS
jgi:hypothetical protein